MPSVPITKELFDNMSFDTKNINIQTVTTTSNNEENKTTVLIVFANSDINAALYYLEKSLKSPFDAQAIATVLVQEAIKNDFVDKLQQKINSHAQSEIKSSKEFVKALATAKKLNALLITAEMQTANHYQPTLVCDFIHEQLGVSSPSGVLTFHTFRTAKEAIALIKNESLNYTNACIWQENHGHAYELVVALKSENYFINCQQMPLHVLKENIQQGKSFVTIDKSYHYETFPLDGIQKSIVFPIGGIFAN